MKMPIEELFTAFQKFQNASRNAVSSIRQPAEWQTQMDKARDEFKKVLTPSGIADLIDWEQSDED